MILAASPVQWKLGPFSLGKTTKYCNVLRSSLHVFFKKHNFKKHEAQNADKIKQTKSYSKSRRHLYEKIGSVYLKFEKKTNKKQQTKLCTL